MEGNRSNILPRLQRLFYQTGPANGKLLILPVDQGVEHGPSDFMDNPAALAPEYLFQLANVCNMSAVAFHIGMARRYACGPWKPSLIVKMNGRTNINGDVPPYSELAAAVEEALRCDAVGVGYTIYPGSARESEHIKALGLLRREAERVGLPLVVWAYPRGKAVTAKGGRDALPLVAYAARLAMELGADLIKVNYPLPDFPADTIWKDYEKQDWQNPVERIRHVVQSAGGVPVLMSGGSRIREEELLGRMEAALQAGIAGFIVGRNFFQRPLEEASKLAEKIHALLVRYAVKVS